jgi:hypothetical protein
LRGCDWQTVDTAAERGVTLPVDQLNGVVPGKQCRGQIE